MIDTGTDTPPDATLKSGRIMRGAAIGAFAVTIAAALLGMLMPVTDGALWTTSRLLFMQDLPLAGGYMILASIAMISGKIKLDPIEIKYKNVIVTCIGVIIFCFIGRRLFLDGYNLVRDEQLVEFDAWIYGRGHLIWPLAEMWRSQADALNMTFMYPASHPVAWVSSYLPGNAVLHALVGKILPYDMTAPLLAGGSICLLWSCSKKLWPDDREAATISLLILVLSGQFLITAMTTWAMTAHLFFNLLWLRLYLCDRRPSDLAAMAVGALATGLHQPLFHPLFAAPFLFLLVLERRWTRAIPYFFAYVAIGAFWWGWPHWIQGLVVGGSATDVAGADFGNRLRGSIQGNSSNVLITSANLLRFIVWGHVAMLPLLFSAWPSMRRDRIAAALASSVVLPLVAVAIILPFQGYGFGFRYLHQTLGSVALLAGYGWRNLRPLHRQLRPMMLVSSLGVAIIALPAELIMSHQTVAGLSKASAAIDASKADFAIIRSADGIGYGNIVYNLPDLSNRPIRLSADFTPDHGKLAKEICRPGVTIAMPVNSFFRAGTIHYGAKPFDTADATMARLRVPYEAAGCRIVALR